MSTPSTCLDADTTNGEGIMEKKQLESRFLMFEATSVVPDSLRNVYVALPGGFGLEEAWFNMTRWVMKDKAGFERIITPTHWCEIPVFPAPPEAQPTFKPPLALMPLDQCRPTSGVNVIAYNELTVQPHLKYYIAHLTDSIEMPGRWFFCNGAPAPTPTHWAPLPVSQDEDPPDVLDMPLEPR